MMQRFARLIAGRVRAVISFPGRRWRGLAAGAVLLAPVMAVSMLSGPPAAAGPAHPAAGTAAAGGGVRLPHVGHDATFRYARCPNPIVPGVPQLNLGPNFRCGYLTVPENRHKPNGRKIQVAVAIARAATAHPHASPLLWLEGGPGGTGLAAANRVVGQGINADRQVIFVDQRGTLKARPLLDCPGYDRFLDRAVALAPENPATGRKDAAAVGACYRHWAARGFDLSAFNTPENAADMADLRIALHIHSWNVYGVSYGTDLALQYLRDYPAGIRTEVLDSVVPPRSIWSAGSGATRPGAGGRCSGRARPSGPAMPPTRTCGGT
jgi:pimeloyl-ACP methyl ester carboxylesterase